MKLRKYQRGYLGDSNNSLNTRIDERCADITVGAAELLVVDDQEIFDGSGGSAFYLDVSVLDDSTAVVTYFTSGNIRGALISRSGDTLTLEDDVVLASPSGGVTSWPTTCRLTDTTGVLFWRDNTALKAHVFTVGGGTITSGSDLTVAASHSTTSPDIIRMTDTTVVVSWIPAGASTISFALLTESSGSLTAGSAATIPIAGNMGMARVDDVTFITSYINSPILKSSVGNISGTSITFGTANDLINPVGSGLGAVDTKVDVNTTTGGWVTWVADAVLKRIPYSRTGDTVSTSTEIVSTVSTDNAQNAMDVSLSANVRTLSAVIDDSSTLPILYSHRRSPIFGQQGSTDLDTVACDQIVMDTFTSNKVITVHRETSTNTMTAKLTTAN